MGNCETMVNLQHRIHIASIDLAEPNKADEDQTYYPFQFIDINPKKIQQSLQNIKVKPNVVIFNDCEMEKLFSTFFYNRFNSVPKILEINVLEGLKQQRIQSLESFN